MWGQNLGNKLVKTSDEFVTSVGTSISLNETLKNPMIKGEN
jgi:hypothetical protein